MPEKVSKSPKYLKKCQNFDFLTQTNPFLKIKQHFRWFEKLLIFPDFGDFGQKSANFQIIENVVKSSKMGLFGLENQNFDIFLAIRVILRPFWASKRSIFALENL